MKRSKFLRRMVLGVCAFVFVTGMGRAQQTANLPEQEQWFMDLGFGMFIHWSLDSQVGAVISHSMAGASKDYMERFVNELPKTFNPRKFEPDDWAVLAK